MLNISHTSSLNNIIDQAGKTSNFASNFTIHAVNKDTNTTNIQSNIDSYSGTSSGYAGNGTNNAISIGGTLPNTIKIVSDALEKGMSKDYESWKK
jgi:hypothetical protein